MCGYVHVGRLLDGKRSATRRCVVVSVVVFVFRAGAVGVCGVFSACFDTPVDACVRKGSGVVRVAWVCVGGVVGVSFSLAARHGGSPLGSGSSGSGAVVV